MIPTRKYPAVKIDTAKCEVPLLCKKCLQACPMAVFQVRAAPGKEERLKEIDPRVPGNYVLSAPRRDKCTVCNRCTELCPADAIRIETGK